MGSNLSSDQIAKELDLDHGDAWAMTTTLRQGIIERRPEPALSGEVEWDEVYVVAGGSGEFVCGDERQPFRPEDLLFAAAGVEHRFENFTEDFAVWVMFYGPEGGEVDAA